jgi:hypothetical protein
MSTTINSEGIAWSLLDTDTRNAMDDALESGHGTLYRLVGNGVWCVDLALNMSPDLTYKVIVEPPEPTEIPWRNDWATHRAIDRDGDLYEYDHSPMLMYHEWYVGTSHNCEFIINTDASDWRNSLEERPSTEDPTKPPYLTDDFTAIDVRVAVNWLLERHG